MLRLKDKRIGIIGLGVTGQSCVRFLLPRQAKIFAFDTREQLSLDWAKGVELHLGNLDVELLKSMDMLLLSPGLPLSLPEIQQAKEAGVEVIGDIELFARFNQKPVIAITGSNGKSTVTSLVVAMLEAAGKKVAVGGNIGIAALDLLDQDAEFVVLELSSFQLETTFNLKPLAATVLNVSEDHLDRYVDFHAYRQAKLAIYQGAQHIIVNRLDPLTFTASGEAHSSFALEQSQTDFAIGSSPHMLSYQGQDWLDMRDCKLVGAHNHVNIQAAAALCLLAGIDLQSIAKGAKSFAGLPHRCQLVSQYKGVLWLNDSKATNVGATQAALEGLLPELSGKLVLIAGGEGKDADFAPLAQYLDRVHLLITLGVDGKQIAALKSGATQVASMQQAVELAAANTEAGDMVLLSPACASFDMFDNYQHRGETFAQQVKELSK